MALDNLATTEAAAQADTQLAQLQHVDRVLQNEAGGILDRERFCAVLAEWYPDLRQVDPASLSSPSGRA